MKSQISIPNKKARFEYEVIETFCAGIVLTGTEIKSVRQGKVSLADTWCDFIESELFVKNMNISAYDHGNIFNHEPMRLRKLLLNRGELKRIRTKVKERGLTVIPLKLFVNEKGFAKLEIALAKGKKLYDKRESIKEKDQRRSAE